MVSHQISYVSFFFLLTMFFFLLGYVYSNKSKAVAAAKKKLEKEANFISRRFFSFFYSSICVFIKLYA